MFWAGIARLFMLPYNFKVWATPPELAQYSWIGERVLAVTADARTWILGLMMRPGGLTMRFRFPLYGGTGEIFTRLAARVAGHLAPECRRGSGGP